MPPREPERKIVLAIRAAAIPAMVFREPRAPRVSKKTSGTGTSISISPA